MRRLLIIGAGGYGRELASNIEGSGTDGRDWMLSGFLDDNLDALEAFPCRYGVLGRVSEHLPQPGDLHICAIGDPTTKLRLCRALREKGAEFAKVVHPTAHVGRDSSIGPGFIAGPFCFVSTNVTVGEFVTLNCFASVGHDVKLGNGVTLNAHCDVTGGAVLGEGVSLGTHAAVVPRVRVGDYAVVGAGSVAFHNVPAHTTVLGVPARRIFRR